MSSSQFLKDYNFGPYRERLPRPNKKLPDLQPKTTRVKSRGSSNQLGIEENNSVDFRLIKIREFPNKIFDMNSLVVANRGLMTERPGYQIDFPSLSKILYEQTNATRSATESDYIMPTQTSDGETTLSHIRNPNNKTGNTPSESSRTIRLSAKRKREDNNSLKVSSMPPKLDSGILTDRTFSTRAEKEIADLEVLVSPKHEKRPSSKLGTRLLNDIQHQNPEVKEAERPPTIHITPSETNEPVNSVPQKDDSGKDEVEGSPPARQRNIKNLKLKIEKKISTPSQSGNESPPKSAGLNTLKSLKQSIKDLSPQSPTRADSQGKSPKKEESLEPEKQESKERKAGKLLPKPVEEDPVKVLVRTKSKTEIKNPLQNQPNMKKASSKPNPKSTNFEETKEKVDRVWMQPKWMAKFDFDKKKKKISRTKSIQIKSLEDQQSHGDPDDDFTKLYDDLFAICKAKKESLPASMKINDGESSKLGSIESQINLDDLLKSDDEISRIRKPDTFEETRSPKLHHGLQVKTFSFKDNCFIINVNPPIEEVEENSENASEERHIETPPQEQVVQPQTLSVSNSKRMQYKFDAAGKRSIEEGFPLIMDDFSDINKDKAYRRTAEEFFDFEGLEENFDYFFTKSQKSRCRDNFFAFVKSIILYPCDVRRQSDTIDSITIFKDEMLLNRGIGFVFEVKPSFIDIESKEYELTYIINVEEAMMIYPDHPISKDDVFQGFENDLHVHGTQNLYQMKMLNGEILSITTSEKIKSQRREFEKKPIVNYFDQVALTKKLKHFFELDIEKCTHNLKFKEEFEEQHRFMRKLIQSATKTNWEYMRKLFYKFYNKLLFGCFEHIYPLGTEKIVLKKTLQKKEFGSSKLLVARKRGPTILLKDREEAKISTEINGKEDTGQSITDSAVRKYNTATVRPYDLTEPNNMDKGLQIDKSSTDNYELFKNTIKNLPSKLELKNESEKPERPPTIRFQTLPKNEGETPLHNNIDEDKLLSVPAPRKIPTLTKHQTLSPSNDGKGEIKSKFFNDEKTVRKETLSSFQSLSPTAANSQQLPVNNEENTVSRAASLNSNMNLQKGPPSKSETMKSIQSQKDSQKESTISIKQENRHKKKESFTETAGHVMKDPHQNIEHVNSFKNVVNQNQQKMGKTASMLKNRLIWHEKKSKLLPEDLISEVIFQNNYMELEDMIVVNQRDLLETKDEMGNNLLMLAAKSGHIECVRVLLNKNIEMNAQNFEGDTALHMALAYGNYEVADLLIQRGAKQTIRNLKGKVAWDIAL